MARQWEWTSPWESPAAMPTDRPTLGSGPPGSLQAPALTTLAVPSAGLASRLRPTSPSTPPPWLPALLPSKLVSFKDVQSRWMNIGAQLPGFPSTPPACYLTCPCLGPWLRCTAVLPRPLRGPLPSHGPLPCHPWGPATLLPVPFPAPNISPSSLSGRQAPQGLQSVCHFVLVTPPTRSLRFLLPPSHSH